MVKARRSSVGIFDFKTLPLGERQHDVGRSTLHYRTNGLIQVCVWLLRSDTPRKRWADPANHTSKHYLECCAQINFTHMSRLCVCVQIPRTVWLHTSCISMITHIRRDCCCSWSPPWSQNLARSSPAHTWQKKCIQQKLWYIRAFLTYTESVTVRLKRTEHSCWRHTLYK